MENSSLTTPLDPYQFPTGRRLFALGQVADAATRRKIPALARRCIAAVALDHESWKLVHAWAERRDAAVRAAQLEVRLVSARLAALGAQPSRLEFRSPRLVVGMPSTSPRGATSESPSPPSRSGTRCLPAALDGTGRIGRDPAAAAPIRVPTRRGARELPRKESEVARPWVPYVVQQGDHLRKLAFRFGIDGDALWNNARNERLAARRKSGDMLCPGDVLYVPNDAPPPLDLTVGSTNVFSAEVPTTHVTLHVDASAVDRLKGRAFEVHGAGDAKPLSGTVSADGGIEFDVPVTLRTVDLWIPDAGVRTTVFVGDLDPIDEPSGVTQRLRNLGFLHQADEVERDVLVNAIRTFQKSRGLEPDGALTAATVDALRDTHRS